MRTITGYVDGRAIWVDHGPGYGGSVKIGGQLVTSGPRSDAKSLALDAAARNRAKNRIQRARQCGLDGRCHHPACTALRADEASRLYHGSNMTLQSIGARLGGRTHKSVRRLIGLATEDAA